jgi:hypothetical protein
MQKSWALDHVAFGVPQVDAVLPFLIGRLGGRAFEAGPGRGFRWWQWKFEGGGVLEVLQPAGPPDGFLHRFLAARGPGVHHVTLKVPDIHAAMQSPARFGYDVIGFAESPGWKEAFLHPRQAQGIVVQLAQSIPELDVTDWPFPDPPTAAPAPVRVVGLRLSAHSEQRARRQWEEMLGAAAEGSDGEWQFHWPGSPLRLSVSVDPDSPEGPRCVEIASAREVDLDGAQELLGTPFVRRDTADASGRAGSEVIE